MGFESKLQKQLCSKEDSKLLNCKKNQQVRSKSMKTMHSNSPLHIYIFYIDLPLKMNPISIMSVNDNTSCLRSVFFLLPSASVRCFSD